MRPGILNHWQRTVLAGLIIGFLFAVSPVAQAQVSLNIGISKDKAVRAMLARGYEQIEVYKKGFSTIRAWACLNGVRYQVRVDSSYRIKNQERVGVCRRQVTPEAIETNLTNSGYTRVFVEARDGNFVALGCRNSERIQIIYSRQGRVLKQRKVGECKDIFQPNELRRVLRDQGYDRIEFTDRQLPWYGATACQGSRKYELRITRFGDIGKRTRIGSCAAPIDPQRLVKFLKDKGYSRVEVIDDRLPVYKANACFTGKRMALELNRFGTITSEQQTGRCRNRMNEAEIVELLEGEGFERVQVRRISNGNFEISACFDGFEKFATLSRFGELLSERDGNRCVAPRLNELQDRYAERGLEDLEFFVEGCRQGRKVRIKMDGLGKQIGRERIGNC